MTVKPDRPGFATRQWRSALQRGIDTVSECTEVAAQKLSAAADPRARMLRKRRWALRLGVPRERRIAGLCLPVMDVAFEFRGLDAGRVLERFFMYFQRGGG